MKSNILKKWGLFILVSIISVIHLNAQSTNPKTLDLHQLLAQKDSLVFEVGFNKCDTTMTKSLIAEDFEFYHDTGGIDASQQEFMNTLKNGLCRTGKNELRRELVKGSLKVFPLKDNGNLYGAIQMGVHRFTEINSKKTNEHTLAQFTHLWLLKEGMWKISRVLSYDHKQISENSKKKEIFVSESILENYIGQYRGPQTGLVTISKKNNQIEMNAGKMKFIIYAQSETLFFHKESPLTFEFIKNDKNQVIKFIVREQGKIVEEAIKNK